MRRGGVPPNGSLRCALFRLHPSSPHSLVGWADHGDLGEGVGGRGRRRAALLVQGMKIRSLSRDYPEKRSCSRPSTHIEELSNKRARIMSWLRDNPGTLPVASRGSTLRPNVAFDQPVSAV